MVRSGHIYPEPKAILAPSCGCTRGVFRRFRFTRGGVYVCAECKAPVRSFPPDMIDRLTTRGSG